MTVAPWEDAATVSRLGSTPPSLPPCALQNAVYWTAYALTWSLVPLLMAYTQSGEFTLLSRLRDAAVANLRFYLFVGSAGLLGVLFLVGERGQLALLPPSRR